MFISAVVSTFLMASFTSAEVPAPIHVAWVNRLTSKTAALVLREADSRLMARCFDSEGLDSEDVEAASLALVGTSIDLFQGPRRISQGRVLSVQIDADSLLPCAVEVIAKFDRPLPLIAKGDVLWATNQPHPSSPRESVRQEVAEIARGALPSEMADLCLEQRQVTRRGVKSGTYVGFTCAESVGKNIRSALVFVPRPTATGTGQPRLVMTEDGNFGELSLVEVLNPKSAKSYRLVLRREWHRPGFELNRLELWEDDGQRAQAASSEALASDMLFLRDENFRALDPEAFGESFFSSSENEAPSLSEDKSGVLFPGTLEGLPLELTLSDSSPE